MYPSEIGITCVTPSPESTTVPVKPTFFYNDPGKAVNQLEYNDIVA